MQTNLQNSQTEKTRVSTFATITLGSLLSVFCFELVANPAASAFDASAFDDKTVTEESLWNLCKGGMQMNAFNPTGSGYVENTLKGMMMRGNITARDYQASRAWFASNCQDGW